MKTCSAGAELSHTIRQKFRRMDEQINMKELIVTFRSFGKTPKNQCVKWTVVVVQHWHHLDNTVLHCWRFGKLLTQGMTLRYCQIQITNSRANTQWLLQYTMW